MILHSSKQIRKKTRVRVNGILVARHSLFTNNSWRKDAFLSYTVNFLLLQRIQIASYCPSS